MTVKNEIKKVVDLPVGLERAWEAIATPEGMALWFSETVQFELKEGADMFFDWDDFGDTFGRVEVLDPPQRFVFRWQAGEGGTPAEMDSSNSTLVEMALESTEGGSRLTVTESGFAGLAPEWHKQYAENDSGWDSELADLIEHFSGITRVSKKQDQAVFLALADPTRRDLIARLSQVEAETASNLARRLPITRQAISKHFAVLEEAGLVRSRQVGRERRYILNPAPLDQANDWLDAISDQWDRRLERLKDVLSGEED